MGLDMYLEKRTRVKKYSFQKPEEQFNVIVTKGGKPCGHMKPERIAEVTEEVMYWRKANHLHQWFVDNCQDGKDDCRDAYVSDQQLQELLTICETVIKSLKESSLKTDSVKIGFGSAGEIFDEIEVFEDTEVAEELLPRAEGFFFGSSLYDKWYLESLEETAEVLRNELKDIEAGASGDYYYTSSW